jgi:heavy metal sensor kinase
MSSAKALHKGRFGTIRTRLTLWSASVTSAVCVLLCGVLYISFAHSLQHEIDGFLAGEVHQMAALLAHYAQDPAAVQANFALELGARPRGVLVFRLKSADGRVLVSSDTFAENWQTPLPPLDQGIPADPTHFATANIAELDYPVRVCTQTFTGADGSHYVAEAAYALDRMYASLATFRTVALVALVVAVAGAVGGGVIIAGRSLRPVELITKKANEIGAQRLGERLPLRGTGDELDRLAETLNRMLERVEDHVRRVRQFTADASHELRSPLAVLRGNAEVVLARQRTADELRTTIEQSLEHYDRLTRIADDLLLLAKGDAGELRVAREPLRLADAIRDVVDLYGPLAEERGIALRAELNGDVLIRGDQTYLRQLLSNLIDNAVKYVGNDRHVTVTMGGSGDITQITVADDGPGIPPEHLPHVFDRFYRADQARSGRGPRGCGLGLPICRMIVEAHGGTIRIESQPGHGTVVVVSLPQTGG